MIFIIGPGRTGTSLLGEYFNSQEDIFYFFEPLRTIADYYNHKYTPSEQQQSQIKKAYFNDSIELLKDIVACKFRPVNNRFIRRFQIHPSKTLQQFPRNISENTRCNGTVLRRECFKQITASHLNDICQKREYRIVIKVLTVRLPYARISSLANLPLPANHELRVIHAMRDPRAFLYSKYKLKWFGQPKQIKENPKLEFATFVNTTCALIEQNLNDFNTKTIKNKNHLKINAIKYRLLRYEEYQAANIMPLATSLTNYIGPQRISIGDYILKRTRGPSILPRKNYSLVPRDIRKVNEKWRKYMKPEHVQIIQNTCKNVMKRLGYKNVMIDLGTQTITV